LPCREIVQGQSKLLSASRVASGTALLRSFWSKVLINRTFLISRKTGELTLQALPSDVRDVTHQAMQTIGRIGRCTTGTTLAREFPKKYFWEDLLLFCILCLSVLLLVTYSRKEEFIYFMANFMVIVCNFCKDEIHSPGCPQCGGGGGCLQETDMKTGNKSR
jgi:hypothetical protein